MCWRASCRDAVAEWLGLPTLDSAIVWVTSEDEIPFVGGGTAMKRKRNYFEKFWRNAFI